MNREIDFSQALNQPAQSFLIGLIVVMSFTILILWRRFVVSVFSDDCWSRREVEVIIYASTDGVPSRDVVDVVQAIAIVEVAILVAA